MIGADSAVEAATQDFLGAFELIAVDDRVARSAVKLRREYRMKLPDAIVWASAQVNAMLFVTRNTKDFPSSDPAVRAPYQL